ncbi:ABC transporter domain-containing protein [Sarocladium implicatum]|nr:ABC transporter domain-containing protein [Sarocladium implicatum]
MGKEQTELGMRTAFYVYPCLLFVVLLGIQAIQYYHDHRRKKSKVAPSVKTEPKFKALNRAQIWIVWTLQLILSCLVLGSIIFSVRGVLTRDRDETGSVDWPLSSYVASYVGIFLYFLAGLLPDPEGPWTPGISHCCAWIAAILMEILIISVIPHMQPQLRVSSDFLRTVSALGLARVAILVLMIATFVLGKVRWSVKEADSEPEERQSLLQNGHGSTQNYDGTPPKVDISSGSSQRTQVSGTGWLDYLAGFKILFPYLWPKDSPLYQGVVVLALLLLICQRTVNVLAPLQLGTLVDSLGEGKLPYKEVILYIIYRGLQGNQGILGAARSVMWIPVSQSLFRRLSTAAFEHVLGLSLEFHLSKKIGEVTSALSRGSSLNTFLEGFCFQVFPMVFDIFVAGVVFFAKYDAFYTIIVFFIMWSYIFLTIYLAKYRGKQRRDMTIKGREMEAIKTDAIMAYETVQHNCAVPREAQRFKDYVLVYQRAERLVQWSLNGLNLTQNSIFTLGTALLVGVSAYKISIGEQTVGEFVTLINYFVQLQAPLGFFGTYYTMLQNNLIEAERMLDLFKERPGVEEKPDAVDLPPADGKVEFNNVKFSYGSKGNSAVLDGVSFSVPPGTKTAIVGESGAGKSTCLKLVYRFYDVDGGSITIDGRDLKDLKTDSIRRNIGVVPQDTVLFNATILYNLQYANPDASETQVQDACRAANIHDRILTFPDGYQTKVGERGLKLSGGERQRIAIARAILKDARILLLDEATASLDSNTEKQIQDALEKAVAGRTTITIAHRLSTITKSDQIIVLHDGKVVEKGTHDELLSLGGRYSVMWERQSTIDKEKAEKEEEE